MPVLDTWEIPEVRLTSYTVLLKEAVENALSDAPTMADGDWCRWCPAHAGCPKQVASADAALDLDLDGLNAGPNGYDSTLLGEWLAKAATLKAWIKSVESAAHNELEAGRPVPGYKLVAKRANRSWVDEESALKRLKGMRLPMGEVFKKTLVSPAGLDKIIKAKGLKPRKWDDLVHKSSSGTTLAESDDPRPAVIVNQPGDLDLPENANSKD